MAFKLIALASVLACASAGVVSPLGYASPAYGLAAASPYGYGAPIAKAVVAAPSYGYAQPIAKAVVAAPAEFDAHPQYNFAYSVQDALTGDNKHQEESRDGDVVKGSYSLVEADGTRRIVEYTADPINGFNAVVHKEGVAVQKAVVAAPAYAKVAAPLAYGAPIARAYAPAAVAHYAPAPVAKLAYGAPAYSAYAAAPIAHGYAAPAYGYASAPVVAKAYLG